MKVKTYVVIISEQFPKTHISAGQPTEFEKGIRTGCKIHTIRNNVELWAKRITEVAEGRAILCVRKWSGKPYASKQVKLFQFGKDDGVGLQVATPLNDGCAFVRSLNSSEPGQYISLTRLADNDGLNRANFDDWFKGWSSGDKAIIHFTSWRYTEKQAFVSCA